jgi:hypothetical protein
MIDTMDLFKWLIDQGKILGNVPVFDTMLLLISLFRSQCKEKLCLQVKQHKWTYYKKEEKSDYDFVYQDLTPNLTMEEANTLCAIMDIESDVRKGCQLTNNIFVYLIDNNYIMGTQSIATTRGFLCSLFKQIYRKDLCRKVKEHKWQEPKVVEKWGNFTVGKEQIKWEASKTVLEQIQENKLDRDFIYAELTKHLTNGEGKLLCERIKKPKDECWDPLYVFFSHLVTTGQILGPVSGVQSQLVLCEHFSAIGRDDICKKIMVHKWKGMKEEEGFKLAVWELSKMEPIQKEKDKMYIQQPKNDKSQLECPICFETNLYGCLIPCGHIYCEKCINTIEKCALCNGPSRKKQKLFFS